MIVLSTTVINPATASPFTDEKMQQMQTLIQEMKTKGVLIATGGRHPGMLELAVERASGNTGVTDGPFTESKEFVGGFALLNVKDREDAIYWTNRFLDVAGNARAELREINLVESRLDAV